MKQGTIRCSSTQKAHHQDAAYKYYSFQNWMTGRGIATIDLQVRTRNDFFACLCY